MKPKSRKRLMVVLIIVVVLLVIASFFLFPIIRYAIYIKDIKSTLGKHSYIEIPLNFNDKNHFCIPCQINGDSVNLIVDTKTANLMGDEMIEYHGGFYWGKFPLKSENAYGEKSEIAFYAFESLKIGDQEIKKPLFSKIKKENAIYDILGDGVLGSDMLSIGTWKFDVENRNVKLFHSDNEELLRKETEGYLKINNGLLDDSISLSINNILEKVPFTFDLGFGGNVEINNGIRELLIKNNYPYRKIKRIVGNFNLEDSVYIFDSIPVRIDTIEIENCELVNISSVNDNFIGASFIKNFNFVLMYGDYIEHKPQKHLFLKKRTPNEKEKSNQPLSKFGISISKYTSKVFISRLLEAGTAEKNGLELGEEVVAVNHNDFDIVSPDKIKESAFNAYTEELDTLYIKTTKGEYVLVEDEELKEK